MDEFIANLTVPGQREVYRDVEAKYLVAPSSSAPGRSSAQADSPAGASSAAPSKATGETKVAKASGAHRSSALSEPEAVPESEPIVPRSRPEALHDLKQQNITAAKGRTAASYYKTAAVVVGFVAFVAASVASGGTLPIVIVGGGLVIALGAAIQAKRHDVAAAEAEATAKAVELEIAGLSRQRRAPAAPAAREADASRGRISTPAAVPGGPAPVSTTSADDEDERGAKKSREAGGTLVRRHSVRAALEERREETARRLGRLESLGVQKDIAFRTLSTEIGILERDSSSSSSSSSTSSGQTTSTSSITDAANGEALAQKTRELAGLQEEQQKIQAEIGVLKAELVEIDRAEAAAASHA